MFVCQLLIAGQLYFCGTYPTFTFCWDAATREAIRYSRMTTARIERRCNRR